MSYQYYEQRIAYLESLLEYERNQYLQLQYEANLLLQFQNTPRLHITTPRTSPRRRERRRHVRFASEDEYQEAPVLTGANTVRIPNVFPPTRGREPRTGTRTQAPPERRPLFTWNVLRNVTNRRCS
jgi:hypothetical protein